MSLRVNDLLPDARLDQIETQIRREFPALPDGAIFNTYMQPAGLHERNGLEIPVPEAACIAILVPNPKWPDKPPQYRAVKGQRWLSHWRQYENQRQRIVGAPDVPLTDFRAAAKRAVQLHRDAMELN